MSSPGRSRAIAAGIALFAAAFGAFGQEFSQADRATEHEPRPASEFRPSLHGFRFVNSFEGTSLPLPASLRESASESTKNGLLGALGAPSHFGLCGGMSLAAAEFFVFERKVPSVNAAPQQGSAMFDYLHESQMRSLGPLASCAVKFMDWMKLPDAGDTPDADSCALRSVNELPQIRERLQGGRFAQIGIVFRSTDDGPGNLWRNHQVLAYAWEESDRDITIRIYDPNYPLDDEARIVITGGAAAMRDEASPQSVTIARHTSGRAPRPIRGIFDIPIRPSHPPESVQPE